MYEFVFGKAAEWRHTALLFNYHFFRLFSGMQEKYLQNPYKALRDKVSEKCILYVVPCLKT